MVCEGACNWANHYYYEEKAAAYKVEVRQLCQFKIFSYRRNNKTLYI